MQHLWSRRDGESARAYHCFTKYLNAGSDRSVVATYRQITGKKKAKQASGVWNAWVLKFEWVERATAYDSREQELTDDERHKLARADDKKWAARRRALAEEEFKLSEELIAAAREVLNCVDPESYRVSEAAKLMALGTLIKRRATDYDKHAEDEQTEQVGAKVIRFPVPVPSADEWSTQYKKKA